MDYVIDVLILSISVVATFLSANPKINKKWLVVFLNVACWALILVYGIFLNGIKESPIAYCGTTAILIVLVILVSIYIVRKNVYSKKRVAEEMIKFTNNIKSYEKIRLFCGDVSFLGNVSDDSIAGNGQYNQIKKLNREKSCGIQILCHKPLDNKEFMLRLGFLLRHLRNLEIKFYVDRNCDKNCDQIDICSVCDKAESQIELCYKCRRCQHNHRCYNPDINLRGRIITSKNGVENIILTGITDDESKYNPVVFNKASSSGSLYMRLWDIWWRKSEEDEAFLSMCVQEYDKFLGDFV